MTAQILGVANNKGGVGKTAVTVNLAAALARAGLYVLVADVDPQGNATRRLKAKLSKDSPTISEAITSAAVGCAAAAVAPCGWDVDYAQRIFIIPAVPDLANRAGESHLLGAPRRLAKAMTGLDGQYDVILLDCEPSLGHLTQMALACATGVLAVVEPEYDAVESAVRLRDFVTMYRDDLGNHGLDMVGYLPSRVREGLSAHKYQLQGLPQMFEEDGVDMVWSPLVPERAAVKDANEAACPVEQISQRGREVAGIYDQLAARYLVAAGAPT